MTVLRIRRRRLRTLKKVALGVVGMAVLCSAAGCSLLHSNIKGGFSCSAPGGTCAPTNVIDDAALRDIRENEKSEKGGTSGDLAVPLPGSATLAPSTGNVFVPAAKIGKDGHLAAAIDGRALRVVYPSHRDGEGKIVPKTIAYAVVDLGDWSRLRSEPVLTVDGKVSTKVSRGLLGAAENAPDLLALTAAPTPAVAVNDQPAIIPPPSAKQANAAGASSPSPIDNIKAEAEKILAAGKARTAGTFTPSGN